MRGNYVGTESEHAMRYKINTYSILDYWILEWLTAAFSLPSVSSNAMSYKSLSVSVTTFGGGGSLYTILSMNSGLRGKFYWRCVRRSI